MKHIDFWFSIGSTYTFLTVMRLRNIANEERVEFRMLLEYYSREQDVDLSIHTGLCSP